MMFQTTVSLQLSEKTLEKTCFLFLSSEHLCFLVSFSMFVLIFFWMRTKTNSPVAAWTIKIINNKRVKSYSPVFKDGYKQGLTV